MKIMNIVGARPNFIKIAPLQRVMESKKDIDVTLVHTGQHFDCEMSDIFFRDLNITKPQINLGVGAGSCEYQIAGVIRRLEPVIINNQPDLVVVVGDVNSSLAAAVAASRLNIKIAHIEAGMRSFNRKMPEEMNRIRIDHISDFLFTTDSIADENLLKENIKKEKIFRVGDVMIDVLYNVLKEGFSDLRPVGLDEYAVLTLHRCNTVDDVNTLKEVLKAVNDISKKIPVIFPIHPRTKKMLSAIDEFTFNDKVDLKKPMGYKEFVHLILQAKFVMTDSGGLQKETTALDVPCLTLRNETEWTDTITKGTNVLVGLSEESIVKAATDIINGNRKHKQDFELWDGKASQRIVKILLDYFSC